MTLNDLLSNAKALQDSLVRGDAVREVVTNHQQDILDLQRYQLLQGKASSGEDLRPFYTEDLKPNGYFNSVESAKRYAAWKGTISYPQQAERNADAPNLYINGKFHNELRVRIGNRDMVIDGSSSYSRGIIDKYGLNNFGLSKEKWNEIFFDKGGYDELMDEVKRILYY